MARARLRNDRGDGGKGTGFPGRGERAGLGGSGVGRGGMKGCGVLGCFFGWAGHAEWDRVSVDGPQMMFM